MSLLRISTSRRTKNSKIQLNISKFMADIPLFKRLNKWRNRRREEEDDLSFPDEVDTPKEISARIRFQRFRGMRSFRTSPWDPFENLPRDYARIFQFEDFKRTERAVRRRAEQEMGVVQVCFPLCINVCAAK